MSTTWQLEVLQRTVAVHSKDGTLYALTGRYSRKQIGMNLLATQGLRASNQGKEFCRQTREFPYGLVISRTLEVLGANVLGAKKIALFLRMQFDLFLTPACQICQILVYPCPIVRQVGASSIIPHYS
jgi:hypothetical protein